MLEIVEIAGIAVPQWFLARYLLGEIAKVAARSSCSRFYFVRDQE
jgi:hypothetical protein